jgi:hypothetical protein
MRTVLFPLVTQRRSGACSDQFREDGIAQETGQRGSFAELHTVVME